MDEDKETMTNVIAKGDWHLHWVDDLKVNMNKFLDFVFFFFYQIFPLFGNRELPGSLEIGASNISICEFQKHLGITLPGSGSGGRS